MMPPDRARTFPCSYLSPVTYTALCETGFTTQAIAIPSVQPGDEGEPGGSSAMRAGAVSDMV